MLASLPYTGVCYRTHVLPHTCATSLGAAEANLLFGRGFRAGIDRREQKKTAAESEADMQKRMRDQLGA